VKISGIAKKMAATMKKRINGGISAASISGQRKLYEKAKVISIGENIRKKKKMAS